MKKKNTVAGAARAAAAAAVLVCLAVCASAAGETGSHVVPAVYVFGDSLVDVGNNNFLPPPAPRAEFPCGIDLPDEFAGGRTGRFTNGYNLADIVAQHLGFNKSPPAYLSLTPKTDLSLRRGRVGANYASGGSGILNTTGNGTTTLREQVQQFADTKASMLAAAGELGRRKLDHLLSQSLFLVCTGGNDFAAFADGRAAMDDAPAYIADMVSTYINHIKALYELGARRFGVLDVLPIGCVPSTRASMGGGGGGGACNHDANALARRFNGLLRVEMAGAASSSMPAIRYSVGSIYNTFSDMIADPRLAGVGEVASGCCGGGKLNAEVDCSARSNLCADRGGYVFWDKVHGTEVAYRWAAVAIFDGGTTRYAEPVGLKQLVQRDRSPYGKLRGAADDPELLFAHRSSGRYVVLAIDFDRRVRSSLLPAQPFASARFFKLVHQDAVGDHSDAFLVAVLGVSALSLLILVSILERVRRMMRLSEEEDGMPVAAGEARLGRVFHSPTLFEDMVKFILLCNFQLSLACFP